MYRRLRELRENMGWTQEKVGKKIGMSQTGYNQYEIGKNDISTIALKNLAEIYHVSVDYILDLTDEKTPYPRRKKETM